MLIGSMRGPVAGVRFCCKTASANVDCTTSPSTSWRTCGPNCWRTIFTGTLPGRNPFNRTVRLIDFNRSSMAFSTRSAGTWTSMRRSRAPVVSTETCIDQNLCDDFTPANCTDRWCERRDSNPHGVTHWNLNPARLPVPPLSPSIGVSALRRAAPRGRGVYPRVRRGRCAVERRGEFAWRRRLFALTRGGNEMEGGGPYRTRTYNQLIKSQLLYQLS